ncbi:MAG: CHAT domain-containing protein, partial [Elainellaceae cyanobacterium]
PPSLLQASALRSLGDAYQVTGYLDEADEVLKQSLAIAQQFQDAEELASISLSLGNVLYSQGIDSTSNNFDQQQLQQAGNAYRQAAESPLPETQVQAQLNLLKVAIARNDISEINTLAFALSDQLYRLPPNRTTLFAHINFADSLITLAEDNGFAAGQVTRIEQHLTTAYDQAESLGDPRATAFALGTLGKLYETTGNLGRSQDVSEEALLLAQQLNATDMSYLWQWQLGRVLKAQGKRDQAIAAYSSAIDTLQLLRQDLVSVNKEVQFSFRESIEPLHRELVSLLLDPNIEPTAADLEKARKTIESLQLAELDNFFREACLNASEVQIDEVDRRAAVIYPIILEDRLEVILSLPEEAIPASHGLTNASDFAIGSESEAESSSSELSSEESIEKSDNTAETLLLRHFTRLSGGGNDVITLANELRDYLRRRSSQARVPALAQQLYSLIIEPFENELQSGEVKTLVFVLDGALRNVPMSALYDGEQYLIEKYSVALAPSLQLVESSPLQPEKLNILLGGLSEALEEFPEFQALPGVEEELANLEQLVPGSRRLLNDEFTDEALREAINNVPFPVVHLATHGQFSSNQDDTFILVWKESLDINEINQLLLDTELGRRQPIELLVLSACETAGGDDRAVLGLAGMAVRAGARSTVATLWQFQDEVAPLMMNRFYQELQTGTVTKAEALRQAQLSILENPNYSDPFYWSLIVLVGNWL